jgi:hypothetical protein
MEWKDHAPVIHLVEGMYAKGISVCQEVLEELKQFWKRSGTLPKWNVVIQSYRNLHFLPLTCRELEVGSENKHVRERTR